MTSPYQLAIIGGGNMGAALAGGMLESGSFAAADLVIVEVVEQRRDQLAEMFAGVSIESTVPPCAAAVLAVKPPGVPEAASVTTRIG